MIKIKQFFVAALVVSAVIGFVMNAYAQPKAVPVTELKFTTTVPEVSTLGRAQKAWIEKVEKDAGGRLKIIPYWANSMFRPREIFRGALDGQADLCYWVPIIDIGLMPLNSVMWLPMMGWPSVWAQSSIYSQLLKKYPQLAEEYRGLMVYGITSITATHISTIKRQVRVPADLRGMKITPATDDLAKMMIAAGGAPVNLVVADWYTSAERGLTEGFVNAFGAKAAFRVMELLRFHTLAEPGGFTMTPHFLLINPKNWARIPSDIQKILADNEQFYIDQCNNAVIAEERMGLEYAEKHGRTTVRLAPAEYKQWADLAQPIHDEWLKKNAAKDAKEIYDTVRKMIAEYKGR